MFRVFVWAGGLGVVAVFSSAVVFEGPAGSQTARRRFQRSRKRPREMGFVGGGSHLPKVTRGVGRMLISPFREWAEEGKRERALGGTGRCVVVIGGGRLEGTRGMRKGPSG